VEATELKEAIRTIVELVDGLLVVVARFFKAAEQTVNVTTDLQRTGELIDAIEVAAEGLLRLEDGSGGGVDGLVEVARGNQFIDATAKDVNEGSGR
jgi:hypothetical protein